MHCVGLLFEEIRENLHKSILVDLRSGYWQISVDHQDQEKTAFVTPDGLFLKAVSLLQEPKTVEQVRTFLGPAYYYHRFI